jgi:hypothetical protein
MASRDEILGEIRRIAEENGGRAPGKLAFATATGIREADWSGIHWARWSDAVIEAGLEPNRKQGKLSTEYVLQRFAEAVRHFGRVPVTSEIRMYARENARCPGHQTFYNHFGSRNALISALIDWVHANKDFSDLIELMPDRPTKVKRSSKVENKPKEGFVYLLKSGDHYKIGRSDELERRVKQISVALPEEVTLEHAIRTDDPPGIERYWHRRFADQRANGEWFKLTPKDIRAFKRRKFQ